MNKLVKVFLLMLLSANVAVNDVQAGGHGGGHFSGGGHFGGGHHHGGWGFSPGIYGFGLGYGLGYGSGYYGGYYPWGRYGGGYYGYPPTIVTVPTQPPVYIQQRRPAAQQFQVGYWYYCSNPQGYYPYIKECLTHWQPVDPRPTVPH